MISTDTVIYTATNCINIIKLIWKNCSIFEISWITYFYREVNAALANASLAHELQIAKIQQRISAEEVQIDVAIRRKEIEIEDKEITRKEKELVSTVKLPVEAESYRVQTIAEGQRLSQCTPLLYDDIRKKRIYSCRK